MISPAVDEVVATGQFLLRARREGRPFWRTFWLGGADCTVRGGRPSGRAIAAPRTRRRHGTELDPVEPRRRARRSASG